MKPKHALLAVAFILIAVLYGIVYLLAIGIEKLGEDLAEIGAVARGWESVNRGGEMTLQTYIPESVAPIRTIFSEARLNSITIDPDKKTVELDLTSVVLKMPLSEFLDSVPSD